MNDATSDDALSISFRATDGGGERLDRYLARQMPEYSRSRLQKWIALGAVTSPNRALNAKTRLTGHETIEVIPQPLEADTAFVPEPVDFGLVYEDESLVVINKPAGLVVHPGAGNWHGTLMNGLLYRYKGQNQLPRAGIVHRLDKDTSGLLVIARTEPVRQALITQLAARTVSRQYLALCHGLVHEPMILDGAIGRDSSNRLRMAVRADGKPALTRVRKLAHGLLEGEPVSLVHCRLASGRTHQIRVHLAAHGHPLVGDQVYRAAQISDFHRQALHAFGLALEHPNGGPGGPWIEPLPADMVQLLRDSSVDFPTDLIAWLDP